MYKLFIYIGMYIFLLGCSSTQSNALTDPKTPVYIESEKLILKASGKGDAMIKNLLGSTFDFSESYDGYNYYQSEFTNLNNIQFDQAYRKLCIELNGVMHETVCESNETRAHVTFGYMQKKGSWNKIVGKKQTVLLIFEATQTNGKLATFLAKTKGYITFSERIYELELKESKKAQRIIMEEERRLAKIIEAQIRKNKIIRNRELSTKTRNNVIQRGSKICHVERFPKTFNYSGFTEDYANGKIKILLGDTQIWDTPNNWFLCE